MISLECKFLHHSKGNTNLDSSQFISTCVKYILIHTIYRAKHNTYLNVPFPHTTVVTWQLTTRVLPRDAGLAQEPLVGGLTVLHRPAADEHGFSLAATPAVHANPGSAHHPWSTRCAPGHHCKNRQHQRPWLNSMYRGLLTHPVNHAVCISIFIPYKIRIALAILILYGMKIRIFYLASQ